jgi:hypothetical protein
MGTGSFPGVKRLRHDADHPPPSGDEVKKEYSYTSNPVWAFGSVMGYLYLYIHIPITGQVLVTECNRESPVFQRLSNDDNCIYCEFKTIHIEHS